MSTPSKLSHGHRTLPPPRLALRQLRGEVFQLLGRQVHLPQKFRLQTAPNGRERRRAVDPWVFLVQKTVENDEKKAKKVRKQHSQVSGSHVCIILGSCYPFDPQQLLNSKPLCSASSVVELLRWARSAYPNWIKGCGGPMRRLIFGQDNLNPFGHFPVRSLLRRLFLQ